MTFQLPLGNKRNLTFIAAYAPTMPSSEEYKDKFYEGLNEILATTSKSTLSDSWFSVTSLPEWELTTKPGMGILGKDGIGKQNDNGLRLLRMCSINELTITNTLFRLPNRQKTSWMHPRSKHWHLIDYVLTRKKDQKNESHKSNVWCQLLDRSLSHSC